MGFRSTRFAVLVGSLGAIGCGGTPITPPPPPPPAGTPSVVCASQPVTQLATGEHVILDPLANLGCVRFPAPGASGAQYLMVVASTSGARTSTGIQGPYVVRGSSPAAAAPQPAPALLAADPAPFPRSAQAEFDGLLRERERALVAAGGLFAAPPSGDLTTAPPVLGEVKSFKVCATIQCTTFNTVQATARYVGTHAAVFIDNDVPQNDPLTPADAAELGSTFDEYHYPIDTTAFGRESDIDQNGVVIILMTDQVNALTPNCQNGRVVGYFTGSDLSTGANSNQAEIFYTLVPAPQTGTCGSVTRRQAVDNLKPTLLHEFQHMISFNQHVMLRSGSPEEAWLNEGLSHFAEELGGRLIPDEECVSDVYPSCESQYSGGNVFNAYDYLRSTEAHFLVFPTTGNEAGGTLEGRGAVWLFLRWVADHYASVPILGTDLTRAMVRTSLTGAANVQAVTGETLGTLVPRWLMAIYLDDGPDLPSEPTGLLRYDSWGLRAIWTNPANESFTGFPINPPLIAGSFSHSGTLRGGTGRHFLVVQQANGLAIDLLVVKNPTNALIDALIQARVGVVRIH
jgi:hypothetical protein